MNGVEWGLTMLMTMIKSLIFIPYLLLSGCGEYINIYLDNKFPVNMNNDGNKITVYSTISPETVVLVRGTYTSNKCQRSHFNSDYTEVSYSSLTQKVEVERKIAEDNKTSTYTVPIDGGGWCNWKLIKIELAPVSAKYKVFVRRNMAISVTNSEYSKIELFTTLAPVIIKDNDEKSIYYASSSTEDERKLSNKSNGEIYFNYKVEPKLTTIISEDEKAIFPNGKVKELQQDIYLKLINFNEIIENSDEKTFTSFVRYID
ncbi:lipoprotein [Proteus mirabilis BB2000]|nr:lipoprotein [Proteus mirabilis BB2000]